MFLRKTELVFLKEEGQVGSPAVILASKAHTGDIPRATGVTEPMMTGHLAFPAQVHKNSAYCPSDNQAWPLDRETSWAW